MPKSNLPKNVDESIRLLIARKVQIDAQLAELCREALSLESRYDVLKTRSPRKGEKNHLDENFARMMTYVVKKESELYGERTKILALLRSIPSRRRQPTIKTEHLRTLISKADLRVDALRTIGSLRKSLLESGIVTACTDCVTSCTECVTSCTECVTSCNGDCISCSSDCVGACTSCSPNGTSGCLDTLGMQSLFERPEKIFDPESLNALEVLGPSSAVLEIDWR